MATFVACPRACGIDIRDHHSSDTVKGGCDTGPMSLSEMHDWFALRGAGLPGAFTMAELIEEHYGKAEVQLEAEYNAICGPMA